MSLIVVELVSGLLILLGEVSFGKSQPYRADHLRNLINLKALTASSLQHVQPKAAERPHCKSGWWASGFCGQGEVRFEGGRFEGCESLADSRWV